MLLYRVGEPLKERFLLRSSLSWGSAEGSCEIAQEEKSRRKENKGKEHSREFRRQVGAGKAASLPPIS